MLEHSHVMGGSTAARRINCAGSLVAEKNSPEQAESEFATQGSLFHAAMELLITADPRNMKEAEPLLTDLLGQDLGFGEQWAINQSQIDAKIRPALEAWFTVFEKYEFDDWFIEQRVSLESVISGAFGTCDILGKDMAKRLHVLDWKFGDGIPVAVEANIGLGFYAGAALYDDDPELMDFCDDITGVVLHIVQPRVGSEVVLHTWETTEAWIEALVNQAAAAMDLALKPNAPFKPGSWCQFCRARPTCDAYLSMGSQALSKAPESMDAVSLGDAMKKADLLKNWISDIYKIAQREMEGGAAIPGFKLVNKLPRRVWADDKQAEKDLRTAKVKVADIFSKKLISPTQAEKLNKALYSKTLSANVVMHSSGLTVVADSDKRQAVVNSMELLANALPKPKQ